MNLRHRQHSRLGLFSDWANFTGTAERVWKRQPDGEFLALGMVPSSRISFLRLVWIGAGNRREQRSSVRMIQRMEDVFDMADLA
ncbi:MAG: hypothetical protein QNJ58_04235 [Desulfobacterales bacterium]|nr:hypothetical protein [Desulfobacterales bacterium]